MPGFAGVGVRRTGGEREVHESLPRATILLVCTYRPGYRPPWMDRSYATQIALQPLGAEDSLALLRSVLPTKGVPDPVVDAILQRAEGNPFFLEELSRAVGEHPGDDATVTVPATVEEVLLARIGRLPDAPRRLLQARLRDPALSGRHHFLLGRTYSFLGEHEQAIASAQRAIEEARRANDAVTVGRAYTLLALEAPLSGRALEGDRARAPGCGAPRGDGGAVMARSGPLGAGAEPRVHGRVRARWARTAGLRPSVRPSEIGDS